METADYVRGGRSYFKIVMAPRNGSSGSDGMNGQVSDWPSDLALGSVSRSPFGRFSLAGRAEGHGGGRNGSSGETDEGTKYIVRVDGLPY